MSNTVKGLADEVWDETEQIKAYAGQVFEEASRLTDKSTVEQVEAWVNTADYLRRLAVSLDEYANEILNSWIVDEPSEQTDKYLSDLTDEEKRARGWICELVDGVEIWRMH